MQSSDFCFPHLKERELLMVPSLYMLAVISQIREQILAEAQLHLYSARNRQVSSSFSHKLKLFESKPELLGIKLLSKLPQYLHLT